MKEAKDYNPSKDPRLINCKTECGNDKCYARRYGLFAEKTCPYFVEPKPITNADRIRAMTDVELSIALCRGGCPPTAWEECGVLDCPKPNEEVCEEMCSSCWLDWLKQEVKE